MYLLVLKSVTFWIIINTIDSVSMKFSRNVQVFDKRLLNVQLSELR